VPASAVLTLGTSATLSGAEILRQIASEVPPSLYARLRPELEHLLVGTGLGRVVGRERKPILRNADVALRRGQLIAIAGASGSGKSTLIKVLNGYTGPDSGSVFAVRNSFGEVELGYVPQDDIIHRELRLRDAIVSSARLRFPPGTPDTVIEQRANEVLTELGLKEHGGTVVSRLSGGQRKRASVALELMTRPRLLLLDEPTSGLDPASDRRLMRLLRSLADSGYGILLVTHTTANIAQCDTVAFLAHGGYLVFWGSPEEAKQHFNTQSLEEVYEKLDSDVSSEEWRRRFEASEYYERLREDCEEGVQALQAAARPADEQPGSKLFRWQLAGLAARYFKTLRGDQRNLLLLLVQVPVILLLMKLVLPSNVLSVRPDATLKGLQILFIIGATVVWLGTINAAREICKELAIWERERHVGVRPIPYLLSKVLVLSGLALVQTLVLVAGLVVLWDVPGGTGTWAGIWASGFTAAVSGLAVGLTISALASTPDRAMALVPVVMIPQIIFGGTVVPLEDIGPPGQAISSVVGTRWVFQAMGRLMGRADYLVLTEQQHQKFVDPLSGSWLVPLAALVVLSMVILAIAARLVARDSLRSR
jgi:ABC-type multidrug transport system ATPase subunit